jgi:hypothetical protein
MPHHFPTSNGQIVLTVNFPLMAKQSRLYLNVVFVCPMTSIFCANATHKSLNHMDTSVIEVKLQFRFMGQLLCDILPDWSTIKKRSEITKGCACGMVKVVVMFVVSSPILVCSNLLAPQNCQLLLLFTFNPCSRHTVQYKQVQPEM